MAQRRSPSPAKSDGHRVLVAGEAMWNYVGDGSTLSRSTRFDARPGGSAVEVGGHLRAAGHRVTLRASLGSDRLGHALAQRLSEMGLDCELDFNGPSTSALMIAAGPRGDREFNVYRDLREAPISRRPLPQPLSAVHISAIPASPRAALALARLAKNASAVAPVSFDFNARPRVGRWLRARSTRFDAVMTSVRAIVGYCWFVKASAEDLAVLGVNPKKVRRWLPSGAALVITDGPRGATAWGADRSGSEGGVHCGVRKLVNVDPTGAGDAFVAGALCAALESRLSPPQTKAAWLRLLRSGHRAASAHLV